MAVPGTRSLSRFLKMAVVAGVESAIRIHIDRGDDLNARDDRGQTPLMLSAARNKAAICKLLIDAGADAGLLDPSGKDALGIARAAGAQEAASVIAAASFSKAGSNDGNGSTRAAPIAFNGDAKTDDQLSAIHPVIAAPPSPYYQNHVGLRIELAGAPIPSIEGTMNVGEGDGTFDLTGWEAEEEQLPPEGDPMLSEAASKIQSAISEHRPIDTSSDWEDLEAYLPERASPLARAGDTEARERLRLVLLRAIREGSVPESSIEDLSLDDHGLPNEEACTVLRMVINDLGAETDERFEYSSPDENFVAFIRSEASSDEEDSVAEVLAFIDDLATRHNEPLRIYQRELQREALLTAEAEVTLAQAMESSVEKALDALASWAFGIDAVLEAAQMVKSGAKPLRWLSSGPRVDLQDIETSLDVEAAGDSAPSAEDVSEDDESGSQFGFDVKESIDELSKFSAKAEFLSGLAIGFTQGATDWSVCRNAVASLNLTRGFLLELADADLHGEHEQVLSFLQSMKAYQFARDRMTVANLKLVLSVSKKYLYSGQPLDDLLQEGNIGLIKAVDRYDWRRGFRFSTYATWWIRQQVGRYVADKSKTIRLPVHVFHQAQRIAQAAHALEMKNGRSPAADEIAAMADFPAGKVDSLVRAGLEPMPIHELAVDDLIAMDAKEEFTARDPMEIVEDRQLFGAAERFLGTLKPNEERVLRLRFGIGARDSMTLEEVGAQLDVTRERIRQIEEQAIRRMTTRMNSLLQEFNVPTLTIRNEANEASAIATLLDQARAAGVTVHDDREGGVQKIWVHITETPDSRSRWLVRKLIALGFKYSPGKGYWK